MAKLCGLVAFATALMLLGIAEAQAGGLQARLSQPGWDGRHIPVGQQCPRFGGHGATPQLAVSAIPAGTQALVLAFSDRDYPPMDHGGHGVIGYHLAPGTTAVRVPRVPGNSFNLPTGFFLVHAQANPGYDTRGAYLPPCSGGRNHLYTVTVEAVTLNGAGLPDRVLGKTVIDLGRY